MTGKRRYADNELGLAGAVLSECFKDFQHAVRVWKRVPNEKNKEGVNHYYAAIINNAFIPCVPLDVEDICKQIYELEMRC